MAVRLLVAVGVGLAVTQLAILATTVYLHRTLAHRSLVLDPKAALAFRVLVWITTGMCARDWVAVHRRHHANTDGELDPHSPARLGFWRVQLTNALLYRRAVRDRVSVQRYTRDLRPDRLDRVVFDHALVGLAIGIGILCLAFGWRYGLIAAAVHAVAYVVLSGAINAVGHTRGRRHYENSATNGQVLALITGGEGLHNNHHAAPTSARFSLAAGELDPGWWLVRLLVGGRLARVRHDRVRMKRAT